ncbi:uncharacterized protein isoform X2 [Musca autumnalis]|uniref:uncharacterized protein isoform X2 n=1 Tax=Musca autumnalis TaxID=221902 RepID=UPI003CEE2CB2
MALQAMYLAGLKHDFSHYPKLHSDPGTHLLFGSWNRTHLSRLRRALHAVSQTLGTRRTSYTRIPASVTEQIALWYRTLDVDMSRCLAVPAGLIK